MEEFEELEEWEQDGDQLTDEEIEIAYREEIIKGWNDLDFCPYVEIDYLDAQYLAYSTLHDYEEADRYFKRKTFVANEVLVRMISLN